LVHRKRSGRQWGTTLGKKIKKTPPEGKNQHPKGITAVCKGELGTRAEVRGGLYWKNPGAPEIGVDVVGRGGLGKGVVKKRNVKGANSELVKF